MMARFLNLRPTTIQALVLTACVFILFLLVMPAHPLFMLGAVDTYWHLAAGDEIRALGALPAHDSWSFTAGDAIWYNVAWLYDVAISFIYEHFSWHGLVVFNSLFLAATISLIFATCLLRCENGVVAFIATLIIMSVMSTTLRPHQVTFLCIAVMNLILSRILRKEMSERWLLAMPCIMLFWVNSHGAVLVGFFLLGWYGLQALAQKNMHLFYWFAGIGFAACAMCFINPYGMDVFTGMFSTLGSAAMKDIDEWQPLRLSFNNMIVYIYIPLFILVMMFQRSEATRSERWLAFIWFLLALSSERHLSIFAILSAPVFALGLNDLMQQKGDPRPLSDTVKRLCDTSLRMLQSLKTLVVFGAIAMVTSALLFSHSAAKFYHTDALDPRMDISEEVAFLTANYPHGRFLNDYSLGGIFIFDTRGKIPIYVDGRVETAYPKAVMEDFLKFQSGQKNWEEVMDKYHMDGVILGYGSGHIDRFIHRAGWKLVFRGKTAMIFIRIKAKQGK